MSVQYRIVQWTTSKRWYDAAIAAGVLLYVITFVLVGKVALRGRSAISDEILVMRAFGTCAIVMLHVVLCVGPLSRLDRRFLVLLYNRRHLGVAVFLVGLVHGLLAFGFYHGFGTIAPPVSLLASNVEYRSLSAFPFEVLGLVALLILFVMAATSHDFWLRNLSPRVWKGMHMLVYAAYGLLVLHVALGAMQSERSAVYPVLLLVGVATVTALHVIAGRREVRRDGVAVRTKQWIDAGNVRAIPEGRGRTVCTSEGERIAVFRYDGKVSAMSNACAHQGGPLGEGKIIDGCVTCPWHGYQYRPRDGCAPPPFTERLSTYPVKVERGRVLISTEALPPGTAVEPARVDEESAAREVVEVV